MTVAQVISSLSSQATPDLVRATKKGKTSVFQPNKWLTDCNDRHIQAMPFSPSRETLLGEPQSTFSKETGSATVAPWTLTKKVRMDLVCGN